MKYALVRNNVIENIIEAEQSFVDMISPHWQHIEPLDTDEEKYAAIGWQCINGIIINPGTQSAT